MSDIIENLIEKNGITADDLQDDDIRDQVTEIETDDTKHGPSEEELKEEKRIKAFKAKMSLDGKRERKIPVTPERVEEIIEDFKSKYNIDEIFDEHFNNVISTFHNDENREIIIQSAIGLHEPLLFDLDLFQGLIDWVKEKIDSYVEQELADDPDMPEDKKEVINNLDIHVGLTVDNAGIDKVTLITWHYFLKNLEVISRKFIQENKDELIGYNKQKIAVELYNKELTNILSNHSQMKAFANTIISITFSWMRKYHAKSSRLSKFLYELQLNDMYVMLNTIVRYLIMIAIKNRNPLELRALMSTYISLIHRNIISLLSADITKVKIGYVAAVQYMFEEGERTHYALNSQQMIADAMVKVFKNKNKTSLKPNRKILNIFKNVSELNTADFFEFMNPEYSILDNMYLYAMLGADYKNCENELANGLLMSSKYKSKKNYQPVKKYFDMYLSDKIRDRLSEFFQDDKTSTVFYNRIKNDVLRAVNPEHYVSPSGDRPDIDAESIIKELDTICNKSINVLDKKRVEHGSN